MSLPRPLCPYHFHEDLIWWDGPFKMFFLASRLPIFAWKPHERILCIVWSYFESGGPTGAIIMKRENNVRNTTPSHFSGKSQRIVITRLSIGSLTWNIYRCWFSHLSDNTWYEIIPRLLFSWLYRHTTRGPVAAKEIILPQIICIAGGPIDNKIPSFCYKLPLISFEVSSDGDGINLNTSVHRDILYPNLDGWGCIRPHPFWSGVT
jgi:hypothetical protein